MRARRILRVVAVALAAVLATGLAATAALQLPAVQRALLRAALHAAGGEAIARVEVDRVSGLSFGTLLIEGLSLVDGEGPWLAMDRLEIDWRPSRLLAGRLDIAALTLGTLDVARLPATDAAAAPPRDTLVPGLPFDLRLGRLAVGRIALGEAVAGVPMAVAVGGDIEAGGDGSAFASLIMTPLDGPAGRLALEAALAPGGDALTLSVDYREPAGGLVARLAGSSDLPALALVLSGDGPLADWRGRL
ncbi:MAG: hypothetical protein FJX53_01545, partial [Alphaproteobacteria bacterium]|nr:hypothetical protein [Alphaproteobacteria bacterium]